MSEIKKNFALLVLPVAFGSKPLFLLPTPTAAQDVANDPALLEVHKQLIASLSPEDQANLSKVLGDPADLVHVTPTLLNGLLGFTENIQKLAIEEGFEPEPANAPEWDATVTALATFISLTAEEPAPAAESATPEQELPKAIETVVAEAEANPESPAAEAVETAISIVKEQYGLEVSGEDALSILSGERILKAQTASIKMTEMAQDRLESMKELLVEVLELSSGSLKLQKAIKATAETAALPISASEEVAK